jgi:hypothetical protein
MLVSDYFNLENPLYLRIFISFLISPNLFTQYLSIEAEMAKNRIAELKD